jgi:hypothetical protein
MQGRGSAVAALRHSEPPPSDFALPHQEELPLIVLDWLKNSQDPRARAWREWIYKMAQHNLDQAAKTQAKIKQEMDEMPHQGKHMRRFGIIDPRHHADLQRQFERRGGKGSWFRDPDFLADTRKRNPQLFTK